MMRFARGFGFLYFFRVDILFSPCCILQWKRIKTVLCHVRLMAVLCNNLTASVCRCTRVCWISEQSPQIIRCPQIRFSLIWFSLNSFFVPHRWFDILFIQPFSQYLASSVRMHIWKKLRSDTEQPLHPLPCCFHHSCGYNHTERNWSAGILRPASSSMQT